MRIERELTNIYFILNFNKFFKIFFVYIILLFLLNLNSWDSQLQAFNFNYFFMFRVNKASLPFFFFFFASQGVQIATTFIIKLRYQLVFNINKISYSTIRNFTNSANWNPRQIFFFFFPSGKANLKFRHTKLILFFFFPAKLHNLIFFTLKRWRGQIIFGVS